MKSSAVSVSSFPALARRDSAPSSPSGVPVLKKKGVAQVGVASHTPAVTTAATRLTRNSFRTLFMASIALREKCLLDQGLVSVLAPARKARAQGPGCHQSTIGVNDAILLRGQQEDAPRRYASRTSCPRDAPGARSVRTARRVRLSRVTFRTSCALRHAERRPIEPVSRFANDFWECACKGRIGVVGLALYEGAPAVQLRGRTPHSLGDEER